MNKTFQNWLIPIDLFLQPVYSHYIEMQRNSKKNGFDRTWMDNSHHYCILSQKHEFQEFLKKLEVYTRRITLYHPQSNVLVRLKTRF